MRVCRVLLSGVEHKISRIQAWSVALPLNEGSYKWSGGRSVEVFDTTVVAIHTNTGYVGWGETCPLGSAYLPAYANGVRAGIKELAPTLLGANPIQLQKLNRIMDNALGGHAYVKSPIDVACWDILGQVSGLPICDLLGGRYEAKFPLYRAISQSTPEKMAASVSSYRSEGYRKFQLKVGGDPVEDIERIKACSEILDESEVLVADANTGWMSHEALKVINGVRHLNVIIEQPCMSYQENLSVRNHCPLPFILDESISDIHSVIQLHQDNAANFINLKISKVGGLTKAREIRDLCVRLGIPMIIEDTWGSDIVTATISHLAHSTPSKFLLMGTDFNSYVTTKIADGVPKRVNGFTNAGTAPGLGVKPFFEVLGKPVLDIAH
eukprot:c16246_g1_i1.p1 GENE.c16246_g1_i1~~c16246_g1_i1.p1  ORF type:complete len:381 (+),score=154.03 c16246_g1_i1:39-1181(+)